MIKVDAPSSILHPIALGDSDSVEVGDPVIAIGSPFGLPGTVTSGIVSALHRSMDSPGGFPISDSIQTDAPINHGNSGGPLIDMLGHVIGINTQIQSDSGGSDGVGFAIPSNTVKSVVSQMVAGKAVEHAYLGIKVSDSVSPVGALLAEVYPRRGGRQGGAAGQRRHHEAGRHDGRERRRPVERHRRQEARRQARGHVRAQRRHAHDHGHARHAALVTLGTVAELSRSSSLSQANARLSTVPMASSAGGSSSRSTPWSAVCTTTSCFAPRALR